MYDEIDNKYDDLNDDYDKGYNYDDVNDDNDNDKSYDDINDDYKNEGNRPFPNYLWSLFQSETWCLFFHKKISFHLHVNEN